MRSPGSLRSLETLSEGGNVKRAVARVAVIGGILVVGLLPSSMASAQEDDCGEFEAYLKNVSVSVLGVEVDPCELSP